jgi:choline dehydrogenase-like flavoprotein
MAHNQTEAADYIIIGGGLAGCVVASRLSQSASQPSVILIEAGPDQHNHPLVGAPLGAPLLHGNELEWNYETVPQKSLEGRQIYNCGGRLLSGSSSVNYGGWTRGPAADYDLWSKLVKDDRWSYNELLPYFRRSEHHMDPEANPAQHGYDGAIYTTPVGRKYPLSDASRQAFLEGGIKEIVNNDGNSGNPYGLATWTENFRDGARQPAGVAYTLSKVKVLTSSQVHRVLLSSTDGTTNVATDVELIDGRKYHANKEIIISCGALRTPQVLLLSGIGPSDVLSKVNIPQLVDSPAVGQYFI